jgi:hypothetical protein
MQGETASATGRFALREWRAARVDASAAEMAMKCLGERQDALNALAGAAQAAASLTKNKCWLRMLTIPRERTRPTRHRHAPSFLSSPPPRWSGPVCRTGRDECGNVAPLLGPRNYSERGRGTRASGCGELGRGYSPNMNDADKRQMLCRLLRVGRVKTMRMESPETLYILGSFASSATHANDSGIVELDGEVVPSYKASRRETHAMLYAAADFPQTAREEMQARVQQSGKIDGMPFPLAWLSVTRWVPP